MCSVDVNSGTTHIKTIFSFWRGIGKHFTGNALCSYDDSVTEFVHILRFITIENLFYKPPHEEWGGHGMGPPFYAKIRELPVHKATSMME